MPALTLTTFGIETTNGGTRTISDANLLIAFALCADNTSGPTLPTTVSWNSTAMTAIAGSTARETTGGSGAAAGAWQTSNHTTGTLAFGGGGGATLRAIGYLAFSNSSGSSNSTITGANSSALGPSSFGSSVNSIVIGAYAHGGVNENTVVNSSMVEDVDTLSGGGQLMIWHQESNSSQININVSWATAVASVGSIVNIEGTPPGGNARSQVIFFG